MGGWHIGGRGVAGGVYFFDDDGDVEAGEGAAFEYAVELGLGDEDACVGCGSSGGGGDIKAFVVFAFLGDEFSASVDGKGGERASCAALEDASFVLGKLKGGGASIADRVGRDACGTLFLVGDVCGSLVVGARWEGIAGGSLAGIVVDAAGRMGVGDGAGFEEAELATF